MNSGFSCVTRQSERRFQRFVSVQLENARTIRDPSAPTTPTITLALPRRFSRSSGTALGYGLDDGGSRVRFLAGAGNFSPHYGVQNSSGAHPASYPMGTRDSFPGVKRPGNEADHSLPSSAEVKEYVKLYLHSPIRPVVWCSIRKKTQD
jgi:hypothetical protein